MGVRMSLDHRQRPPPTETRPVCAMLDVAGDLAEHDGAGKSASHGFDALAIAALAFGNPRANSLEITVPDNTRFDRATISLLIDGVASRPSTREQQRPLVTDGGRQSESTENSQQQLGDLFYAVTGTDEVTEKQEGNDQRVVAEQGEDSLAGAVAEVAREDGLDDTLPEPDGSE